MYKLTRPDGYDFYSGTINYRKAVGSIVRVTDYNPLIINVCGRGLHASRNPNDCFQGAKIPCAAFRVKGIQKIAGDKTKSRYQALKVIEEIQDLNSLFGWNYTEAANPIHPFKIKPPRISNKEIQLVRHWASVRDSVWASVWCSVGDPVLYPVWDSVRTSVWCSVGDSVGNSGWCLIWDPVADSVKDSVWGYVGSLFLGIKKWKYIKHEKGVYPFQSVVDLWKMGLVPSYDGKLWRLHGNKNAKILWKGKFN
jgi:hypothetical protein